MWRTVLYVLAALEAVSAHTIMQAVNGNPQGSGIYMPSDDSVRSMYGKGDQLIN